MNAKVLLSSISVFFFLLVSNVSWAHAMLEKSSPAKNEVLKTAPKQITLTFEHPVKLTQFKLEDQNATEVPVPVDLKASANINITVPVPPLDAGKYHVTWSALSNDGHVMRGTLSFSIEKNNAKP